MAKKKTNTGMKVAEAAGAAALAAAAAGYYFYGTAKAKKHRQAASVWAKGLKSDVTKKVKTLKKIDAKSVAKVVDEAASAYHTMRGVATTDVHHAAKELKANWKRVHAELAPSRAVSKVRRQCQLRKSKKQ